MKRRIGLILLLGLHIVGGRPAELLAATGEAPQIEPSLYSAMKWREIGPYRGGRVAAVTGVPGKPLLYYMGATGGGVWKTENGGVTWVNLSDGHFNVGTIGAIAVAPSDHNVLYVGTGEAPIRGVTTSHGDGVYKSTDAGKSWTHVGLKATRQISRIRVHPSNPDLVWVAAQGNPWGPNPERGVYRSQDGGKSWELVLSTNPDSGAVDLSLDADNPRILYAAMWDHRRSPWFVRSGGPGGGVYKSTDGGSTWEKLTGGLPELVGKIGVAVSPANSERVYAIVEAEKGGLYRSDNGGKDWKRLNSSRIIQARAWYYNHIAADPIDENTVYVLNAPLMKSIDGGKTFETLRTPHGDHHDHWINPADNKNMINGNDGGATVTFDGGQTWSSLENQPTAQFYRVATDNRFPYFIYGGQQDNSTVAIASETFDSGIGREDYYPVGGGESAHIAFDPANPRYVYATTINASLDEYDSETRRVRPIQPYPEYVFGRDAKDHKYRTNWNAPVAVSPHDPSVIYYGAQVLLRSSDRGQSWREISPDLTRNDKEKQGQNGGPITNEQAGAEFYNTIFYIVESPHEAGTIWVGSDDGLVHLTRDGGQNWRNVTPPEVGEALINAIEVSPHRPGKAYLAVAGYKLNDFSPHIFRTEDYGKTWTKIVEGIASDTFVRVVREDPSREGLLYAGTEAGTLVSFDDGAHWQSLQLNLPKTPVTDLTIRQNDLVAATQGRGFWVLDDLAPLQQIQSGQESEPLLVFEPSPALRLDAGGRPDGPEGDNPPRGAVIDYFLKESPPEDADKRIEILDQQGRTIRTFHEKETEADRCKVANADQRRPLRLRRPEFKKGMNRWIWDLQREDFECVDIRLFAGWDGAHVPPGTYQARVQVGDLSATRSFEVRSDPRIEWDAAQGAELEAHLARTGQLMSELIASLRRLRSVRGQLETLVKNTAGLPAQEAIQAKADEILKAIATWEEQVVQTRHETFEDDINWPNRLDVQIMHLLRTLDQTGPPVSSGAKQRLQDLETQWAGLRGEFERISGARVAEMNALLLQSAVGPVQVPVK